MAIVLRRSVVAVMLVAALPAAVAAPLDPFVGSSPTSGSRAPDVRAGDGDGSVSDQTGAASYTVPIPVPPGRGSMAPSLALRYSSSGALRGEVAAGWSLDLPTIELDRSRLRRGVYFRASLGGASGPLYQVADAQVAPIGAATYRLRLDESFVRFEQRTACSSPPCRTGWTALTSDGTRYYFDDDASAADVGFRWNLTDEVDPHGNTVHYVWERVSIDGALRGRRLARIEYTSNPTAGLAAHAKVELAYAAQETCPGMVAPIGSMVEVDRTGNGRHYRSPSRLLTITSSVKSGIGSSYRLARRTSLSYDTTSLACNRFGAPVRILTKIDQTGWNDAGLATLAPTITLGYDRVQRLFDTTGGAYTGGGPEAGDDKGTSVRTMDFDGDGLRDRLSAVRTATGCYLSVQRGVRGGWYGAAESRSLPGVGWSGATLLDEELCSLDGQLSFKSERDESDNPRHCNHDGVATGYRWLDWDRDGDLDLVTNRYYDPFFYEPGPGTPGPTVAPSRKLASPGGDDPLECNEHPMVPEVRPDVGSAPDAHVLRIYANLGDHWAAPTIVHTYAKLPLPGGGALDVSGSGGVAPAELMDLDGDGFMDVVDRFDDSGELKGDWWYVSFGDGGDYTDPVTPHGAYWQVPPVIKAKPGPGGRYYSDGNGESQHYKESTASTVTDLNGDGRPDLVLQSQAYTYLHPGGATAVGDGALIAFLNTGDGFADEPMLLDAGGAIDINQLDISAIVPTTDGWMAKGGDSGFRRRLLDLDADGFLDLVLFPANESNILDHSGPAFVEFGNGDGFIPGVGFDGKAFGPALIRGGKRLRHAADFQWTITSELVDIDGDGLVEPVEYTAGGFATWRTDQASSGPLRLLTTVDNGRGAVTRFHYEPSTEPGRLDRGSGNQPGVRWVVARVVTSPGNDAAGVAQPSSTTEYGYADPVYGDLTGAVTDDVGFRGFGAVTTVLPGGGKTVRRYDYARPGAGAVGRDGRGQLVSTETWTWDPAGRYELVSLEDVGYQARAVLGGEAMATLPSSTVSWTCHADVLDAATCRQATSNAAHRITTWEAIAVGGVTRMYAPSVVQEGVGATSSSTDRRTVTGYHVRYGQSPYARDDYRVLPATTELHRSGRGTGTLVARSTTTFGSNGLPDRTYVATQTGAGAGTPTDATAAVTSFGYDTAGNLITTTRPSQQSSGLLSTTTYDGYGIYPIAVQNELGHVTSATYDLATGQQRSWSGPNSANVTCNGVPCGAREGETFVYDGLGRLLSRRVAMGFAFSRSEVEKVSYDDVSRPTRVTTQKLLDGTTWMTTTTSYDALGRTVEQRTPVSGKPDSVRRFGYDGAGNLVRTELPDPRVDTGERVSYTWSHDSLGRVLTFRRPDATGTDVVRSGPWTRLRQITNDASVGADTSQYVDPLGLLTEVREHVPGGADAVTRYGYDVRDALTSVVDADGNRTELEYDARGNRSLIRRGTRLWRYTYNRDGALESTIAPVPGSVPVEGYTTRLDYDALGRLRTRTPARRGLSDAALDAMGVGPTVFSYDVGAHAIGRLGAVEIRRWGSGPPAFAASYGYDPRGLLASESRTVRVLDPQPVTATASVTRSYTTSGALAESVWDDGQTWRYGYDERGMVETLSRWSGDGWQTVSTVDHALNGVPRSRVSLGGQRLDTTLDILGRARRTEVTVPGVQTPRAAIDYVYQGDLNLKSKSGQTAGLVVAGDYSYDARGRLVFAQGADGRFGGYEYSPAGNLTQLEVSDGDDITELTYAYGATDPQAVDSQRRVDGSLFASYTYDPSGNVTRRVVPGGTYDLTWDGMDRLRAVTGPAGRETYLYDHGGNRIAVGEAGGARVWFAEMEMRVASNGAVTRRYLHLADDSGPVARVENGTDVEIQYADAQQNLLVSLGAEGQVEAAFTYDSFGENLESVGDGDHRRQFNGKENDARTGLRYYGYRYYDPVSRRWTAADPLFRFAPDADLRSPQHQNLYAFSVNNPIRYYDPDGRKSGDGTIPSNYRTGQVDVSATYGATYSAGKQAGPIDGTTMESTVSVRAGAQWTAAGGPSVRAQAQATAVKLSGETDGGFGGAVNVGQASATVALSAQGVDVGIGVNLVSVEGTTPELQVGPLCVSGRAGAALGGSIRARAGSVDGKLSVGGSLGPVSLGATTRYVGWDDSCDPEGSPTAIAAMMDTLKIDEAMELLEPEEEPVDQSELYIEEQCVGDAEKDGYLP